VVNHFFILLRFGSEERSTRSHSRFLLTTFILMNVLIYKIQNISERNAVNRTKQKYMHHIGKVNFDRVRTELV